MAPSRSPATGWCTIRCRDSSHHRTPDDEEARTTASTSTKTLDTLYRYPLGSVHRRHEDICQAVARAAARPPTLPDHPPRCRRAPVSAKPRCRCQLRWLRWVMSVIAGRRRGILLYPFDSESVHLLFTATARSTTTAQMQQQRVYGGTALWSTSNFVWCGARRICNCTTRLYLP